MKNFKLSPLYLLYFDPGAYCGKFRKYQPRNSPPIGINRHLKCEKSIGIKMEIIFVRKYSEDRGI